MSRLTQTLAFSFTFAAIATLTTTGYAATWDGGGDGVNWTDSLNWSTGSVPANTDVTFDDTAGVGTTTQLNTFSNVLNGLQYLNTGGGTHTTDLSGQTLEINDRLYVGVNNGGVSDAVILGGTLDANANGGGSGLQVGFGNQNLVKEGTLTIGTALEPVTWSQTAALNQFLVGRNDNGTDSATNTAVGTLDMTHATGTFSTTGEFDVGRNGRGDGTVIFGSGLTTNIGTALNAQVDIGFNQDNHGTSVGSVTQLGGTANLEANFLAVGRNDSATAGTSATGTLDLSAASGGTVNTIGEISVGYQSNGTGTLTLSNNHDTSLGQSGSRSVTYVGVAFGGRGNLVNTEGTITQNGGNFDLNHQGLYVARNDNGNGSVTGTIDLAGASGVLTNLDNPTTGGGSELDLGVGSNATGSIILGADMGIAWGREAARTSIVVGNNGGANNTLTTGTLDKSAAGTGVVEIYASETWVGRNIDGGRVGTINGSIDLSGAAAGSFYNQLGNFMVIGTGGDATGELLFGDNFDVTMGSTTLGRTNYQIGETELTANSSVDGRFVMTGGTFEGAANQFRVGRNETGTGSSAIGEFDIAGATIGAAGFDVTPEFFVGRGLDATGTVRLGSGIGVVTGNTLHIGDTDTGSQAGGSGLVELEGTNFNVNTQLNIYTSGQSITNIAGDSSGYTIVNPNSSAVSIANIADRLVLNFDDPNFTPTSSDPYYGFRWAADDATEAATFASNLQGWTNIGSRIDVNVVGALLDINDLTFGTYVDGGTDYAFIGFTGVIPEPASLMLLAAGSLMLLRRR